MQLSVRVEWDLGKRLANLAKHKLDFRDAPDMFDGRAQLSFPSARGNKARYVTVSLLYGKFAALIWVDRDGARRIISLRRARSGEEGRYRKLFG
jgi:uncharacterized DUF497 family protein